MEFKYQFRHSSVEFTVIIGFLIVSCGIWYRNKLPFAELTSDIIFFSYWLLGSLSIWFISFEMLGLAWLNSIFQVIQYPWSDLLSHLKYAKINFVWSSFSWTVQRFTHQSVGITKCKCVPVPSFYSHDCIISWISSEV